MTQKIQCMFWRFINDQSIADHNVKLDKKGTEKNLNMLSIAEAGVQQ